MRKVIGTIILTLAFLALMAGVSTAHEWYPADCRSGQDCGPIDDSRVTRTLQDDYVVDGKWIFARDDKATTRQSLSGRYHACFPDPNAKPKCIFVPPEGT